MFRDYQDKMLRNYEDKSDKKKWFIIASGPSLTREDVEKLRNQNIIAINDNYQICPWADVLYACDPGWWKWHKDRPELISFKGEKWTQSENWAPEDKIYFTDRFNLNFITSKGGDGLSLDKSVIHQGSHSGYQAINLAYHMGAREIYLLGYDMQATDGKTHWFGDHPNKVVSGWHKWMGYYDALSKQLPELGLEIINCTRQTALTCFPKMSLESALSLEPAQVSHKSNSTKSAI